MSRKAVLGAVSTFVVACGSAPPPAPKPPEPVAAPAPAPLPAVREAAPELRRYWVFGKSPELSLYADLEGLLRAEVFESVVPLAPAADENVVVVEPGVVLVGPKALVEAALAAAQFHLPRPAILSIRGRGGERRQ